jgi:hypothetical protein
MRTVLLQIAQLDAVERTPRGAACMVKSCAYCANTEPDPCSINSIIIYFRFAERSC